MKRAKYSVIALTGIALVGACASSEDGGIFENTPDGAAASGGSAGVGGSGGSGALGGTGGSGASGGSGGGVGGVGGSDGGSCNPSFCPTNGSGSPCCVTASGPCGFDNGMGCIADPGTGGATGVGGSGGVGGVGGSGGIGGSAGAGGAGGGQDANPDVSTGGSPQDASID